MKKTVHMKTKSSAEINEVIKAKFGTMSYREIGEIVGLDSESVRARARRMGLTGESKPKLPINNKLKKIFWTPNSQEDFKKKTRSILILSKRMTE